MKNSWIAAGICGLAMGVSGFQYFQIRGENQRLSLVNAIYHAEHRILKDEITELDRKPTYDQGFKDSLIRLGGPQQPGAYMDGWEAAMKVAGEGGYANGYHAAIQQFGYQKPDTSKWLIAESNIIAESDIKFIPKQPQPTIQEKK